MLSIQVVGPGCANCERLATLCKEVIKEKKLEAQIEKVTDMNRFAALGVFLTPGLIINGQLKTSGRLPTRSTLEHWLTDAVK